MRAVPYYEYLILIMETMREAGRYMVIDVK